MEISEDEFARAEAAMAKEMDASPRAISARYDRRSARIVVRLNTGIDLAFPPALAEGLGEASPDALSTIEISPTGLGLHWPIVDADLYVPSLLQGTFGSKRWMAAQLGAAGGRSRSPAKAASARENGRRGGRPKKAASAT